MKILFILPHTIGDTVLVTGGINYVMEEKPEGKFYVLGKPYLANLFDYMPRIEVFFSLDCENKLDLFPIHCKWDEVYDFSYVSPEASHIKPSFFDQHDKIRAKKKFILGENEKRIPKIDFVSKKLGLYERLYPVIWDKGLKEIKKEEGVLRVAVCPYAGSPEREWSMENWLELLAKVLFGELERQYEKIEVLFIGLEKNTDDYQMMKLSFGNEVIKPLLSNELIEVYAWLKSADIYVGNDSGITHLAIASGIPVIELWGLKYEVWPEYQPIAENVIIIKDDSTRRMLIGSKDKRRWMDGITIQTVYEQIVFKLKN